jgi:hypothetical protein
MAIAIIGIYAFFQRKKYYSDYVKRKEHDQRFKQGKRKGVEW